MDLPYIYIMIITSFENEIVSVCTPNIETLFVTITNTTEPVIIGVVYRPPNGNTESFTTEYERILAQLPDNNVFIIGTFNINLHTADRDTSNFELTFLSAGFTPTISLITHEKNHCNGTCIDNIFVNSYDDVILSGTISERITHQLPIYCITHIGINHFVHENNKDQGPYYDYSNRQTL